MTSTIIAKRCPSLSSSSRPLSPHYTKTKTITSSTLSKQPKCISKQFLTNRKDTFHTITNSSNAQKEVTKKIISKGRKNNTFFTRHHHYNNHLSKTNYQQKLSQLFGTQSTYLREAIYTTYSPPYWDGSIPSNNPTPAILACSSTKAVTKHQIIKKMIQKMLNKVKQWILQLKNAWLVFLRGSEVAARLSPLFILTPAAVCYHHYFLETHGGDGSFTNGRDDDNNGATLKQLANHNPSKPKNALSELSWSYTLYTLQNLGPAFVKFAQWAATRRDLFPTHICTRLSTLHDNAYVHSWEYTEQMLVEAFGTEYEKNGLIVSPDNIVGSGSAAQVYHGTLTQKEKSTNTVINYFQTDKEPKLVSKNVAVKVLHPNIRSLVERDLLLMERIASLIDSIPLELIKMLSLPRASENFGRVLKKQVDLRVEGENLDTFHDFFSATTKNKNGNNGGPSSLSLWRGSPKTTFPRPYKGWVAHNVLVEEFIHDAKPISDYLNDDTEKGREIRKKLAGPLLRAFLKMVFLDNFVHGDLHPGNVLVKTSQGGKSEEKEDHTIVFLDAGIATSLSPKDQQNLIDLFRAVIFNDGDKAGRLMVERARHERCSQVEGGVDAFAAGIDSIVSDFHDRRKEGLTLGAVRVGSLLGRVLDLCRIHGVEIDPAMATIVLSTLVLEGLGRSLDPDLDLMHLALPFVVSWDNMRRLSQSQFLQVFNHWLLGF